MASVLQAVEEQARAGEKIQGVVQVLEGQSADFLLGVKFRQQLKDIDFLERFADTHQAGRPIQAPQLLFDIRFLLEHGVLDFKIGFVLKTFLQDAVPVDQAGGFDGTFEFVVHHGIPGDQPMLQQGVKRSEGQLVEVLIFRVDDGKTRTAGGRKNILKDKQVFKIMHHLPAVILIDFGRFILQDNLEVDIRPEIHFFPAIAAAGDDGDGDIVFLE